jgi:hypothetical protein
MAISIDGPHQLAWFRALDHARLTGVKPCWRVGDYYTVDSPRSGNRYKIHRLHGDSSIVYTCTCTASAAGKVCWHKALVAALPHEIRLRREAQATRSHQQQQLAV